MWRALLTLVLIVGAGLGVACRTVNAPQGPAVPPPLDQAVFLPLFDPAAVADGRPSEHADPPPVAIVDYGPEGVRRGEPIRVRFNQPLGDLRAPDDPRGPPLQLLAYRTKDDADPQRVAGHCRWAAADTLAFVPDDDLPAATRFEVVLPAGHRNRNDSTSPGARWRFETPGPTVRIVGPRVGNTFGPDEPIFVHSDQAVGLDDLAAHLAVEFAADEAKPWPTRLRSVEAADVPDEVRVAGKRAPGGWWFAVSPDTRWPAGMRGNVRIEAELRGEAGPVALAEPVVMDLRIRDRFRLLDATCESEHDPDCAFGRIVVRTSTEIPEEAVERIRVSPRLESPYVYAETDGEGHSVVTIDGDSKPGQTYTVTLPRSLRDVHGQRPVGKRRARVTFPPADDADPSSGAPSLALSDTVGVYAGPDAARVGILTARVADVRVEVTQLHGEDRLAAVRSQDLDALPWPAGPTQVLVARMKPGPYAGQAEYALDLSKYGGPGDVLLLEARADRLAPGTRGPAPDPVRGLYQISGLGFVVEVSPARSFGWVTRLQDGLPAEGVGVTLHHGGQARRLPNSDADGLVTLVGADELSEDVVVELRTGNGDDRLLVPVREFAWPDPSEPLQSWFSRRPHWKRPPPKPPSTVSGLRAGERGLVALATGRGVYFPGDTVHVAGWGGIATPYREIATRRAPKGTKVTLELLEGRTVLWSGTPTLDERGRFATSFTLPPELPMGSAYLRATMLAAQGVATFTLADTRIPTFELHASVAEERTLHGQDATLRLRANALSGETVPIEHVRWSLSCFSTYWRPGNAVRGFAYGSSPGYPYSIDKDVTVARGGHGANLGIPTGGLSPTSTYRCAVSAAAQDATLQEVGADAEFRVHPAPVYVGVEPPEGVRPGQSARLALHAIDLHGRRAKLDDVTVTITRVADRDDESPRFTVVKRCTVDLRAEGEASCHTGKLRAGKHRVQARAEIAGRIVRTDTSFRVDRPTPPPAPPPAAPTSTHAEPAKRVGITLPDLDSAAGWPPRTTAGEPVRVQVTAPQQGGRGWLVVDQNGSRQSMPFELHHGVATLRVTPRPGLGAGLTLTASVVLAGGPVPTVWTATTAAQVDERRDLEVEILAPERARPGQAVDVTVTVADDAGEPVDGEVALWVVDDGIHQLRRPSRPYLPRIFAPVRNDLSQRTSSYDNLLRPFEPGGRGRRVPRVRQAKAQVKGALDPDPVRQRFEPVPLFVGSAPTGPDGKVKIPLQLPDDLTRFRMTAIASAELPARVGRESGPARFGQSDRMIEVRAPFSVRAALPRIVRPGDEAELAAMVTVPPGSRGRLEVSLHLPASDGELVARGPTTRTLEVDGTAPVRTPFRVAARGAGEAMVEFRARFVPHRGKPRRAGVRRRVAVEVEPTMVETVALYGRLDRDEPVAIPIRIPDAARHDHGGLTLSLGGSALGDLRDATDYLVQYPYGCAEQTASRLVPVLALRGLGRRLVGKTTDPDELIRSGIARLLSLQREDGRFSYWPDGPDVNDTAGAYATWVLGLAAQQGHPVPSEALERAERALLSQLARPLPQAGSERERARAHRAFVVWSLSRPEHWHRPEVVAARTDLFEHRDTLPDFARVMLLTAWHRAAPDAPQSATLRRQIFASIERVAGAAYPVSHDSDRWASMFDSPGRTHALILLALAEIDPDDPWIDELARGLRRRRQAGHWRNTQENALALLAMSRYAARREAVAPRQEVAVWVGHTEPERVNLRRYDDTPPDLEVSMADLIDRMDVVRTTPVVFAREGVGASTYRLQMRWVSTDPVPRSQGMELKRRLVQADRANPIAVDGPLRGGSRYGLIVELRTDVPQHFVAVQIPLPAGLEAIDPTLGAGRDARRLAGGPRSRWLSHLERRADRLVLFFDRLPPGEHVHAVPVLATTPGNYSLPPARAEAMYQPEIRATTKPGRVTVLPRR